MSAFDFMPSPYRARPTPLAIAADAGLRSRAEKLAAGEAPQRHYLGVSVVPGFVARKMRRAVGLRRHPGNHIAYQWRLNTMRIFLGALLTALVAVSCSGSDSTNTPSTPAPLVPSDISPRERVGSHADGDWRLVDGVPAASGFPITLSIAGSDVSGRAACNAYGGTVDFDSGTVSFDDLFQTAMGCEPAAMEAEAAFMMALASVDAYTVSDTSLKLSGLDVDMVFER
ncbi:MAG: META domain-containing protein [Actinomycetota bacterium]|nr:META domain-containing protein [Actinomycetota bacterium]